MKIENEVVCIELAKQMRDAGYPQREGYLYWHKLQYWDTGKTVWSLEGINPLGANEFLNVLETITAPTVAEMGEKLPRELKEHTFLEIHKGIDEWTVAYRYLKRFPDESYWIYATHENKLADAMAKMWLYLKDKGLL